MTPTAVSYADEKFIAKAKAMGYTDEMLEIMKASVCRLPIS